MPSCDCSRRFSDLGGLQQHQISKAYCYCREYDRFLSIQTLLNSIAQRFIPSLASTATEPSSVPKHFRRIKRPQDIATAVIVIDLLFIQTLLNSIAQRFIPLLASTATEPSSVRKRYSSIRSLRNTATAVNAIGSLSIRKHLASTCGHPFIQRSSTVVIVTGTSSTSRLSIST